MPHPTVQIAFNGKVLQTVTLGETALSIGRMRENHIVIDNLGVSRFHAKISFDGQEVILEDQESENGTFVNGERIEKRAISESDEVIIGKHQLLVNLQDLAEKPAATNSQPGNQSNDETSPPVAENEPVGIVSDAWDASSTLAVDAKTQKKILERIAHRAAQAPEPPPEATSPDLPPKKSEKLNPLMVVTKGGDIEQMLRFNQFKSDTLSIGRSGDCQIILNHPQISRKHAIIKKITDEGEDKFLLEDLDTGNGTHVNGSPIEKCQLQDEDQIGIGDFLILFQENPTRNNPAHIPKKDSAEQTSPLSRDQMLYQFTYDAKATPNESLKNGFQKAPAPENQPQIDIEGKLRLPVSHSVKIENGIDETSTTASTVRFQIEMNVESLPEDLKKLLDEHADSLNEIPITLKLIKDS